MQIVLRFPIMEFLLHLTIEIYQHKQVKVKAKVKNRIEGIMEFLVRKAWEAAKWQHVFIVRIANWGGLVSRATSKQVVGQRYPAYFFIPDILTSTRPIEQQFVSSHPAPHGGFTRENSTRDIRF